MRMISTLGGVLLLVTTVAAENLVIRERNRTNWGDTARPRDETIYRSDTVEVTDTPYLRTIIDLNERTVTTINKTLRIYRVETFDEVRARTEPPPRERLPSSVREKLERMKAGKADGIHDALPEKPSEEHRAGDERGEPPSPPSPNLPPAVREKLEQLEAGKSDRIVHPQAGRPVRRRRGTDVVFATGKTATIAGYQAKQYVFTRGGKKGRLWAADAIVMRPQFDRWKMPSVWMATLPAPLEKMGSYPLRMFCHDERGGFVSREVVDIGDGSAPRDLFAVPAGFAERRPSSPTSRPSSGR